MNPIAYSLLSRTFSASLALLAMASMAHATPSAYEPFDYSTGSFLTGTAATGDGFTGDWTCGAAGTIVPGLTYTGLPVANNALYSGSQRQFVNLSRPLSSGTRWIGFLFNCVGNGGANMNGIYFPNGGTGLWFGYGLNPYSGTQGQLGLGSMSTPGTAAQGATSLVQLGLGTYGTTYLVVLKIDFDTSGNNDTVTVYLNPAANQATPGVADAGSYGAFDVGTLLGVGLTVQGGGGDIVVDEIRVGDTYGDVVGYVDTPPNTPTGLTATPGTNLVSLSWTASTGSPTGYNVKRSSDSGGPYSTVGTTPAPTVTYDDVVLGGPTYYYVVSAVNGSGESTNSAHVSASPILAAPAVPTGLAAIAGNAQVALSWTASAFATSYTVSRSTELAGPYFPLDTLSAPTVTYTDFSGLDNGATYYYVVSATGVGGASSASSPVNASPVGPMPLVVSIAPGAGITWFASNRVTYQVQWASEDLGTNTVWNNLGASISGNGETNTVFDPVGAPHNVYQVYSVGKGVSPHIVPGWH